MSSLPNYIRIYKYQQKLAKASIACIDVYRQGFWYICYTKQKFVMKKSVIFLLLLIFCSPDTQSDQTTFSHLLSLHFDIKISLGGQFYLPIMNKFYENWAPHLYESNVYLYEINVYLYERNVYIVSKQLVPILHILWFYVINEKKILWYLWK